MRNGCSLQFVCRRCNGWLTDNLLWLLQIVNGRGGGETSLCLIYMLEQFEEWDYSTRDVEATHS